MHHQDILITAIDEAIRLNKSVSVSSIARDAGMQPSGLLRFYKKEQDIMTGNFFKVIEALPEKQKTRVREQLGISTNATLRSLLEVASPSELAEALRIISERYSNLRIFTESSDTPVAV